MAKISIELDVLNSVEIIRHKKGRWLGSLAALSISEKKLKHKVEEEICRRIVARLQESLDQVFKEEGISARLKISAKA